MTDQFTTRMSKRFARQIAVLRAGIESMSDASERDAILSRFETLANDLAQGFPVLERVSLQQAQAELELERAREGRPLGDFVSLELPSDTDVAGLIEGSEPLTSGLRDTRQHEPELAHAGG